MKRLHSEVFSVGESLFRITREHRRFQKFWRGKIVGVEIWNGDVYTVYRPPVLTPHRASCHGATGELQCTPGEHAVAAVVPTVMQVEEGELVPDFDALRDHGVDRP